MNQIATRHGLTGLICIAENEDGQVELVLEILEKRPLGTSPYKKTTKEMEREK